MPPCREWGDVESSNRDYPVAGCNHIALSSGQITVISYNLPRAMSPENEMVTFNDLVGVGKRNDILVKWRYYSYENAMF